MIYVKIVDKKQIMGSKSQYPPLLGGVLRVTLLPPIDKAPEGMPVSPVYIVNDDSDYHDLLVNADEPLEMQPVLESNVTHYKALLVHKAEERTQEQLDFLDRFGVIDAPGYVLESDQTEEAERQADPA
jgi:hypothetical protein